MHLYDTGTERSIFFHFADVVCKKEHLRIANVGDQREILPFVADDKATVGDIFFLDIAPRFQIGLPRSAERRIGKAEVKGIACESVVGDRRAEEDIVGLAAFTLDQHIAFSDSVCLIGVFLTVKVNGDLFAVFCRYFAYALLGDGKHTARSAGAVVNAVSRVLYLVLDRHEGEISDQLNDVAGREMTSGVSDVGFLVELADDFFEHRSHRVIIQRRHHYALSVHYRAGREVDRRIGEFADQNTENIVLGEFIDLVAELEFLMIS